MVVVASAVRVLSAASSRGLGPARLDPGEGLRLAPDGRRGQRRIVLLDGDAERDQLDRQRVDQAPPWALAFAFSGTIVLGIVPI